ncbi:MAG: hypothetical protein WC399_02820 [Bacilli bacterium]
MIIQTITAFLIGLVIFSVGGFSSDQYVDVTYEKSGSYGDIETNRSQAYTGRLQFYLIALLGAAIGLLMAFSVLAIVALILFFTVFVINKFKSRYLRGKKDIFKARARFVRNRILISVAFTLVAIGGIVFGVSSSDFRLEKPSDILSIDIVEQNLDEFLTYEIDSNHRVTYQDVHYDGNIGLKIETLNSAYIVADLQVKIEMTYQIMSTDNGEISDEETYENTLSLSRLSGYEFLEIVPRNLENHQTAYIITSQNVEMIKATALCRYNVTRNFPYLKIGTKDLTDVFALATTANLESEEEPFLYAKFLSNVYIRQLHAEIVLGDNLVFELDLTNTFCLENQSIAIGATDRLYDSQELSLKYAKGFVTELFV